MNNPEAARYHQAMQMINQKRRKEENKKKLYSSIMGKKTKSQNVSMSKSGIIQINSPKNMEYPR